MLGEINCEVPIDTDIENYKVEMADKDSAARFMASLELFKLIEKVGLADADTTALPAVEKTVVKKAEKLEKPVKDCVIDVLFEGDSIKSFVASAEDKAYISEDEELLKKILSDKKLPKVVYDSKPLFSYADKNGFVTKSKYQSNTPLKAAH